MPVFSEHQVDLHFNKHSAAYVKNMNKLIDEIDLARKSNNFEGYVEKVNSLKFNGGGHINHEFWWQTLGPANTTSPTSGSALTKLVQS